MQNQVLDSGSPRVRYFQDVSVVYDLDVPRHAVHQDVYRSNILPGQAVPLERGPVCRVVVADRETVRARRTTSSGAIWHQAGANRTLRRRHGIETVAHG